MGVHNTEYFVDALPSSISIDGGSLNGGSMVDPRKLSRHQSRESVLVKKGGTVSEEVKSPLAPSESSEGDSGALEEGRHIPQRMER